MLCVALAGLEQESNSQEWGSGEGMGGGSVHLPLPPTEVTGVHHSWLIAFFLFLNLHLCMLCIHTYACVHTRAWHRSEVNLTESVLSLHHHTGPRLG